MTISKNVLKKYAKNAHVFIETGTHIGTTTQIAVELGFDKIYTIELSSNFYKNACNKFKNFPQVNCIFGDSKDQLKKILSTLNEAAVFWLDGHWSMGDTACGDTAVPLYDELEVIKQHKIKNHTILIDDLRLMGNQEELIKEWHNISLDDVKQKCLNINPNYKFSFENGYIRNDILVVSI